MYSMNLKEFSKYIREINIEDIEGNECMVSFDATSPYTNVSIKDILNIIKDLTEKDAAFGEMTKIPVYTGFPCLVELVLTKTWYISV